MKMKEYLRSNWRESTPEWLEQYRKGQPLPLREFLQSRTVFYPAAGHDGHPVQMFNSSHSAHCFIFVDYAKWMDKDHVKEELGGPYGFRGYSILDERDVSQCELLTVAPLRSCHLTPAEMEHAPKPNVGDSCVGRPFALFVVFERRPDYDDEHGSKRFAVLFLGADGIATYDMLYANGNARAAFAMILEHCDQWGGAWCDIGQGSPCEKVAERSGVYPEILLVGAVEPWVGYEAIPDVDSSTGGGAHNARRLYRREVQSKMSWFGLMHAYGIRLRMSKTDLSAKACCPFHGEKTPSFRVDLGKDTFHCFGCGAEGDAIDFAMKMDGVSRQEAIAKLAKIAKGNA